MLNNYWYVAGLFAGITLKFSVSTMDEDFPPDMCQIFTSEATLPLPNNGHHKRAIKEGFLRSNDPIRSRPQTQAGHVLQQSESPRVLLKMAFPVKACVWPLSVSLEPLSKNWDATRLDSLQCICLILKQAVIKSKLKAECWLPTL